MTSTTRLSFEKLWIEAWPDPIQRDAVAEAMYDLGLSEDGARAWMSSTLSREAAGPEELAEIAAPWVALPFPTREAIAWAELRIYTQDEAFEWSRLGFSPKQVELIHLVLLFEPSERSLSRVEAAEKEWRDSGLEPDLVVLGVAAAETLSSMQARVASGLGPSERGSMALSAALRGVEVRDLELDLVQLMAGWRGSR